MVQNINVECILNLDTTIKVGDGGVCFTLGGTRNIPVIVADDEPICIESAQANAGIMRGGSEVLVIQKVYDVSRRHNYPEFENVCETIQAYYGGGA